jgi:hypothetical protein
MKLSLMRVKAATIHLKEAVSMIMFKQLTPLLGCIAMTWYKSQVFMNWEKLS